MPKLKILKVPRNGGSVLRVGHSQNFEPNFQSLQLGHASQIVSHILRMWRLNKFGLFLRIAENSDHA